MKVIGDFRNTELTEFQGKAKDSQGYYTTVCVYAPTMAKAKALVKEQGYKSCILLEM